MPISVTCPDCDRSLKAPDTAAGRKIKCPKCGAVISVPALDEELEEVEPVAVKKPAAKKRQPADEDDDRPRRRSQRDDDEDDDDEDDEPRRGKKRSRAAKHQPQLGMGIGSLVAAALAILLALIVWLARVSALTWAGIGIAAVGVLLGGAGVIIALQKKNKGGELPRIGAIVNVLALVLCIVLPIYAERANPPADSSKEGAKEEKKQKKKAPPPEPEVGQLDPLSDGTPIELVQSKKNLKQLALAMQLYHDAYGKFPGAAIVKDGKPLLSWRVAILPFLDHVALHKQFNLDEPWDSEHNKKLIANMPELFRPLRREPPGGGKTYYQVFTGKYGPFGQSRQPRLVEFTDGPANTFLIAEADRAVVWTKPEDMEYNGKPKFQFKNLQPLTKIGGMFGNAVNAAMADGTVRQFDRSLTLGQVHALITASGSEKTALPPQ